MFCSCCGDGDDIATITIRLTGDQVIDAARLAGFFPGNGAIGEQLDNFPNRKDVHAILMLYARIGIRRAIEAQTDHVFPKRYPDDAVFEEHWP